MTARTGPADRRAVLVPRVTGQFVGGDGYATVTLPRLPWEDAAPKVVAPALETAPPRGVVAGITRPVRALRREDSQ